MRNPSPLSRFPPFLLLAAVLVMLVACGEEPAGATEPDSPRLPPEVIQAEIEAERAFDKPWLADSDIQLSIKDPQGKPLVASILVESFSAGGFEGTTGQKIVNVKGTARLEFKKVTHVRLHISADGHDDQWLEFDYTDLEQPWERAADGKSIIIKRNVVLPVFAGHAPLSKELHGDFKDEPFCGNSPEHPDGSSYGYVILRRSDQRSRDSSKDRFPWYEDCTPTFDFDDNTSPTIYLTYEDNPEEEGTPYKPTSLPYKFPPGKRIVLKMHGGDEGDGFFFPGVFSKNNLFFRNNLPEAPVDGYSNTFVLEKQWFLDKAVPFVYVKCDGFYSKLGIYCDFAALGGRISPRDFYPQVGYIMVTNVEGKRDLRTTW